MSRIGSYFDYLNGFRENKYNFKPQNWVRFVNNFKWKDILNSNKRFGKCLLYHSRYSSDQELQFPSITMFKVKFFPNKFKIKKGINDPQKLSKLISKKKDLLRFWKNNGKTSIVGNKVKIPKIRKCKQNS